MRLELVKGSGPGGPAERSIPTLRRDSRIAEVLARSWSRPDFVVEHLAFSLALVPVLLARRPQTVYFSEWHVGLALARWRHFSRQRLRLVFCNGAFAAGPYPHLDRVQQLTPGALEYVGARGVARDRQIVLPLGVRMDSELAVPSLDQRRALRRRLGLPERRQIIISVAALNTRHKRIDYLIEEVGRLSEPRPFLLMVGQAEAEAESLEALARTRLGNEGFEIRSAPLEQMPALYRVSDVFVLTSLWESFGRVLIEALAQGLPCIAHDHPVMRWVLGEEGLFEDLSEPGALGAALGRLGSADFTRPAAQRRHRSAHQRFSWEALTPSYVELLTGSSSQVGG